MYIDNFYDLASINCFCLVAQHDRVLQVAFPCLETLKMSSINLHKIWDDDQLSATSAFQNLTSLIVENCGNLKHLFKCSMIGSLSKLRQLEISKCTIMEEIIDPEEGRNNGVASKEV